ncbi:MAG: ATP-NAD kinase family protein [Bacillota bacterium]|nr:ATP-NAD kinase family protein [Bacillota bacterium]
MKKLGLIINPVAGMGGRVGLKGTDGPEIVKKALTLGAKPESAQRAVMALKMLTDIREKIEMITCPGSMGEDAARQCGFEPSLIEGIDEPTSARDTEKAALSMRENGVNLLLFAGGDGTARNIYNALGDSPDLPVIGIPAGVKIHSAVYATTPRNAGELARMYMMDSGIHVHLAEVMDIDEESFRAGRLSACLYGYLYVPKAGSLMQHLKVGGAETEESVLLAIAEQVVENMEQDVIYIIGPGSTTVPIMKKLGLAYSLLGVDLVLNEELLARDAGEKDILRIIKGRKTKIIVTVIGGQGYIFGRGNQQISSTVINQAGKENIIIIASKEKILALDNKHLLVDTGDEKLDEALRGYYRIVTGYREELIFPVSS